MSKVKIKKRAEIEAKPKAQLAREKARQTLIDRLKDSNAQGPLKDLIDLYLMEKGID
jgi:hypothetical protein